jgi:hypothetical protein
MSIHANIYDKTNPGHADPIAAGENDQHGHWMVGHHCFDDKTKIHGNSVQGGDGTSGGILWGKGEVN